MSTDPDRPAVPGLEPPDARTPPMDLSQDPDRFDPSRDADPSPSAPELPRGLDPARDPDRYRRPGQGQTLKDLLGEGAQEGDRDGYQWVLGLVGVFVFLGVVAFLFSEVLTP